MKKKLSSKSLAILSLVLVLLITSGVFLGLEWRKANDVGVASDGVNAYLPPNYRAAEAMKCNSVSMNDEPWFNYSVRNSLVNLGWENKFSLYDVNSISTYPDTSKLGTKDLVHFYYGHYLNNIKNESELDEKLNILRPIIKKGIERGVKFLINGEGASKDSYLNKLFAVFGLDIKQRDETYRRFPSTGDRDRGYGALRVDKSIQGYFASVNSFYDIKNSKYKVIYESINDAPIESFMLEFSVGNAGSVVRAHGDRALLTPIDDNTYTAGQDIDQAYEYAARLFSCAPFGFEARESTSCVDFETVTSSGRAPIDQRQIDNQFADRGFRFSLKPTAANTTCPTLPQISRKGPKGTAFVGYGEGTTRQDNPHPDNASSLGNYFLTDDGTISKSACQLNVSILPNFRSNRVEFDILDVDYRQATKPERFNVIAYGANSKKLKTVKTPVLDEPSKSYHVVLEAEEPIYSFRVIPIGTVSNWGVAYDNFCSVK